MPDTLQPDNRIASVTLFVSDLRLAKNFYIERLGLRLHREFETSVWLGAKTEFLELIEKPGGRRIHRATGLYHFAILVPTRKDLAFSLNRLLSTDTPLDGLADHLVSEAIYLSDLDGNGIEIYRDRPRSDWPREGHEIRMATERLDIQGLLAGVRGQTDTRNGLDLRTTIGHIHLSVADIKQSEFFYTNVLGFDLVQRLGSSAGFVSTGGYHHHIGYNTWMSAGSPPPSPDALGLKWFAILIPNQDELNGILDRCRAYGVAATEMEEGIAIRDPAHNTVLLQLET
jgi:catechol 2,3-dioxygenase